jgi:hypothetical protein
MRAVYGLAAAARPRACGRLLKNYIDMMYQPTEEPVSAAWERKTVGVGAPSAVASAGEAPRAWSSGAFTPNS